MNSLFALGFFGLIGIFSRYGVDKAMENANETFPASTFLINILGSLAAGCIYVAAERYELSPSLHTSLLVGFCGGFTTFSAFSLQTMMMMEKGRFLPALTYLIISPIVGFLCAYFPVILSKRFF